MLVHHIHSYALNPGLEKFPFVLTGVHSLLVWECQPVSLLLFVYIMRSSNNKIGMLFNCSRSIVSTSVTSPRGKGRNESSHTFVAVSVRSAFDALRLHRQQTNNPASFSLSKPPLHLSAWPVSDGVDFALLFLPSLERSWS